MDCRWVFTSPLATAENVSFTTIVTKSSTRLAFRSIPRLENKGILRPSGSQRMGGLLENVPSL